MTNRRNMIIRVFIVSMIVLSPLYISMNTVDTNTLQDSKNIDVYEGDTEHITIKEKSVQKEDVCEFDGTEFSVNMSINDVTDSEVSGEVNMEFENSVRTVYARSISPYHTEVSHDVPHPTYPVNIDVMEDEQRFNRQVSEYSFNYTIDTQYHPLDSTTENSATFTLDLESMIVNDSSHRVYTSSEILNCVNEINVAYTDASTMIQNNIITVVNDEDREMNTYRLETENKKTVEISTTQEISRTNIKHSVDVMNRVKSEISGGMQNVSIMGVPNIDRFVGVELGYNNHSQVLIENEYIGGGDETVGHEMIHTVQGYSLSTNMTWWVEGSAEYLGSVVEINSGGPEDSILSEAFSNREYNGKTKLSDPKSWENNVQYKRGARLTYIIDREIRKQTNSSITDLMSDLNQYDTITKSKFLDIVSSYTDEEFSHQVEDYMDQTENIDINSRYSDVDGIKDIKVPTLFEPEPITVYRSEN